MSSNCTPKTNNPSLTFDFMKEYLTPDAVDVDQPDAQWSNNPLERQLYYYQSGYSNSCEEFQDIDLKGHQIYQQLTQTSSVSHYKKFGISIDAYMNRTPETELRQLAETSKTLNRIFPEQAVRDINYSTATSRAPVSSFGLLMEGKPINIDITHETADVRIGRYVHEFGHCVSGGFLQDPDLKKLFKASMISGNDLIIKDSSYIKPEETFKALGHIDEVGELFASSFFSYFYQADQLVAFLNDPQTPQTMREFGSAVWCYMRDKVFKGEVFTKDKHDPLSDYDYKRYIDTVELNNEIIFSSMNPNLDTIRISALGDQIDANEVAQNFETYMNRFSDHKDNNQVRMFLYSAFIQDYEAMRSAAKSYLSKNIPQNHRMELLNLIGQMGGITEYESLLIIKDEAEREDPLIKMICKQIIKHHIEQDKFRRSFDPSGCNLTPEQVEDLQSFIE